MCRYVQPSWFARGTQARCWLRWRCGPPSSPWPWGASRSWPYPSSLSTFYYEVLKWKRKCLRVQGSQSNLTNYVLQCKFRNKQLKVNWKVVIFFYLYNSFNLFKCHHGEMGFDRVLSVVWVSVSPLGHRTNRPCSFGLCCRLAAEVRFVRV